MPQQSAYPHLLEKAASGGSNSGRWLLPGLLLLGFVHLRAFSAEEVRPAAQAQVNKQSSAPTGPSGSKPQTRPPARNTSPDAGPPTPPSTRQEDKQSQTSPEPLPESVFTTGTESCRAVPFAMPQFKSFTTPSPQTQKEEVAAEAQRLYQEQEKQPQSAAQDHSCLYKRWLAQKSSQEQDWFEKKYSLERAYTLALGQYVEDDQERANLEAELSPLKKQVEALSKQLDYKKGQTKRLEQRLEFSRDNYRTRFSSISWSMVVIGRMRIPSGRDIKDVKSELAEHMRRQAARALIPGRIQGLTTQEGTSLATRWIQETHDSQSTIIDTFDQEVHKRLEDGPYIYQLHRIEVKPGRGGDAHDRMSANETLDPPNGMNIFVWHSDEDGKTGWAEALPARGEAKPRLSPKALLLSPAEQEYLLEKENTSDNVNRLGLRILKKWDDDFRREEEEVATSRSRLQSAQADLERALADKKSELKKKEDQLKLLTDDIASKKQAAEQARAQYEEHCKRRIILQNRLVNRTLPSQGSYLSYVAELAKDTWPSEEQRSGAETHQILVGKQTGAQGSTLDVEFRMSSIQYRARVLSFQILYLSILPTAASGSGELPFALNVAYEIEQTEGPRVESDLQRRTLTLQLASDQLVTWHWATPETTSLNSSGLKAAQGFILPGVAELLQLSTYLSVNGPEPLTKLGFDLTAPFVSRDKTPGGNYRCIVLPSGTEQLGACDQTDEVNLLWIQAPSLPQAPPAR